jgi:hypothetical protein
MNQASEHTVQPVPARCAHQFPFIRDDRIIISDHQAQYRYTEELHPIFCSEYDAFFLTLKNINYPHDHHNVKEMGKKM